MANSVSALVPQAPVLIPAYKPGPQLLPVIRELLELGVSSIVVVDDGGGTAYAEIFQQAAAMDGVRVVRHAINLGKGAALKTGMNFALVEHPGCPGVVTADADGQHHPEDILRVAQRLQTNPGALIMGVRGFTENVPLRSRFGNGITRLLMRVVVGQRLTDTQTGLRGIPAGLIPHLLRLPSGGYEFELDMLLACKFQSFPVLEETIRTIYLDGNESSHFQPIRDSMRIYFLLFRFTILSLITAGLDNLVFVAVFSATASIAESQIAGRVLALIFNYAAARNLVFQSRQRHSVVFPKYMLLVVCNALLSYFLITTLHEDFAVRVITAKLAVEAVLFIANFAIQRDFVFTRRAGGQGVLLP